MGNRCMRMAMAILILVSVAASTAQAQTRAARPTVALLDFDFGSVQPWWSGNADLGKQVADMLVDELVNDGTYRVIERKRLDAVMNEQNFSPRGDLNPQAMAKICKALGVQYLILGSVTRFALEQSNKSLAGAFGVSLNIGGLSRSEARGTVAITARMINTETGEVVVSIKGAGISKRRGLQVDTRGSSVAPEVNVNFSASDFQVTVMGEATEAAIHDAAGRLVAAGHRGLE